MPAKKLTPEQKAASKLAKAVYCKKWGILNRERRREQARLLYWKNNGREAAKSWRAKNREKVRAASKKWRQANPEKVELNKRIRHRELLHPNRDRVKIKAIYKLAKAKTGETGMEWVVDHIIPQSRGGWHHELNLQAIPAWFNSEKRDSLLWKRCGGMKSWIDVPEFLWPDQCRAELEKLRDEWWPKHRQIIFVEACAA